MNKNWLLPGILVLLLAGSLVFSQKKTGALNQEIGDLQKQLLALRSERDQLKGQNSQLVSALKKAQTKLAGDVVKTAEVGIDDDAMKGDKNAPVTMIEFSEYQCPFCARFSIETLPEIIKAYVDTGKLRIVFRDYPLPFHRNAAKAAEAAECAGDQGLFWEMHDLLFANHEKLAPEDLARYAEELGLFMPDFTFCMESGKNAPEVAGDLQDGKSAGVNSTPSFFIGVTGQNDKIKGTYLKGAKPFNTFKGAIEQALEEAAGAKGP